MLVTDRPDAAGQARRVYSGVERQAPARQAWQAMYRRLMARRASQVSMGKPSRGPAGKERHVWYVVAGGVGRGLPRNGTFWRGLAGGARRARIGWVWIGRAGRAVSVEARRGADGRAWKGLAGEAAQGKALVASLGRQGRARRF